MFLQGRVIVVWLSWLVGGICGVIILLLIICYCRLMPRHQKSFDEKYLKETYTIKESHTFTSHENYKVKHVEVHRHNRPASYAGGAGGSQRPPPLPPRHYYVSQSSQESRNAREHAAHYASSSMLDDLDGAAALDALKTRSLPAALRPRPRPLSTEDDLAQLYAKVNLSKKYKSRMRSSHAAAIALSKSRSQALDAAGNDDADADAVLVYDQRTKL